MNGRTAALLAVGFGCAAGGFLMAWKRSEAGKEPEATAPTKGAPAIAPEPSAATSTAAPTKPLVLPKPVVINQTPPTKAPAPVSIAARPTPKSPASRLSFAH